MNIPLASSVTIQNKNGIMVDFKMINQKDHPVKVYQPGDFQPTTGWEYSYEAYQVAVLQSFHILKMTVIDENNKELNQNAIMTLADHVFRNIDINKGQVLNLAIPLHEFYNLEKGTEYTLTVQYGRDKIDAYVETMFKVD